LQSISCRTEAVSLKAPLDHSLFFSAAKNPSGLEDRIGITRENQQRNRDSHHGWPFDLTRTVFFRELLLYKKAKMLRTKKDPTQGSNGENESSPSAEK